MKDKFKKTWEKVKTFWKGLTKVLQVVILAGIAAFIIGAIILVVVLNSSGKDEFIVLFPGMSREESGQVYELLKAQDVETQTNDDGEIMVRRSQWDGIAYNLAARGYPQTTPSYGTFFDNLGMTMTEFEKHQALRFELQDRLQATLRRIDGIRGAIVTITFPESSNYAWKEDTGTAKATVTLTLDANTRFGEDKVSAVKNLVAFSAQKIEPQNVKVINSNTGEEMLSAEEMAVISNDNTGIDIADKLDYKNKLEKQYEDKAKRMLMNMFPKGVDAVATVDVDYDKVIEEANRLLPNEETGEGFVTDEHREYDTNAGPVDEGGLIVGEENNTDIPGYQNDNEDDLNSDNTPHYEDDVKRKLGYILTQTERAQGTITNASIAVVVATEDAFMTRDQRNQIVDLVRAATNINADNISVASRVITDEDSLISIGGSSGMSKRTRNILIIVGVILGLLLIGAAVLLILLMNRNKKRRLEEQAMHEEQIAELQEIIEEERRKSIEEQADEFDKKERETEEEVREFARNNPELTAALIRSMLKERDD